MPAGAHALGLVAQPPARGRPHGTAPARFAEPRARAARASGGRVQADHEVEAAARPAGRGWRPSARRRPRSAAGRCAPGGRSPGWRTRRPPPRPSRPAASPRGRRPPAGRSRSRTRPPRSSSCSTQPVGTTRRMMRSSESVEMNPRGSQPTASAERRVARRGRERRERQPQRARPDRRQPAVRAGTPLRPSGRPPTAGRPSAPARPSKVSPAEWATMNHGGTPAATSPPDHRARGGADDVVGAGRVPARLGRERVQRPGEPRAARAPRRHRAPGRPSRRYQPYTEPRPGV